MNDEKEKLETEEEKDYFSQTEQTEQTDETDETEETGESGNEQNSEVETESEENLDTEGLNEGSEDVGGESEKIEDSEPIQDMNTTTTPDDGSMTPGFEAEKTFTQSQVNEMVGRARQEGRMSAMKDLYSRYGVNDDDELNGVFGKGQAYDSLNDEFNAQGDSYKSALAENALLKSHADEGRWDDIKFILGGNGLDVTAENIEALLPTHPEWRGGQQQQGDIGNGNIEPRPVFDKNMGEVLKSEHIADVNSKKTTPGVLRKLGNDVSVDNNAGAGETEDERVKKLFGM